VVGGLALGGAALAAGACTATVAEPTPAATVAPVTTAAPTARPGSGAAASPQPAARQPKYGGVLQTNATEPPHFDIHQTSTSTLYAYAGTVYSRLLKYKTGEGVPQPNFTPVADLAESWTQPDETTYVFKLRQGAKFQNVAPVNGREVVADDAIYSFQRQVAQKINAGLLASVVKQEAVDKYTVKLTIDKPDPDFLVNIASGQCRIVPKETVDVNGDLKNGPLIGSGPWIFKEYQKGSLQRVVRNPDYFVKGVPYVDGWDMITIPDPSTQLTAFRGKQIDAYFVIGDVSPALAIRKERPEVRSVRIPNNSVAELGLKTDSGPTQDVRVRQAISKALDRQAIMDTALNGAGFLSAGFTLPSPEWSLPEQEIQRLYQRDLAGARKLMQDAGMAGGFKAKLVTTNVSAETYVNIAQLAVAQLKDINIDLELSVLEYAAYLELVGTRGDYQLYLGTNGGFVSNGTNADLVTRFRSKGPRNSANLSDPRLDAMIDRQATLAKDVEGRKKVIQDLQRYLIAEQPTYLVVTGTVTEFISWPYLQGFYPGVIPATSDYWTYVWMDK
jgi:peptide/nickel transport system substrate-binding protein